MGSIWLPGNNSGRTGTSTGRTWAIPFTVRSDRASTARLAGQAAAYAKSQVISESKETQLFDHRTDAMNDGLVNGNGLLNGGLGGGGGVETPTFTFEDVASKPIKYNVGLPKDAYLPNAKESSAFMPLSGRQESNQPVAVASSDELWTKAGGHKGMLVIYAQQGASYTGNFPSSSVVDQNRYAFQFHYNPSAVNMTWAGIPNVDVNMEATGQETFNYTGANANQGTIDFTIALNRRYDFKYYDPNTGLLRAGVPGDLYSPVQPSAEEQKDIYNKGTMYDVEYLLAALLGYKMKSRLRGSTADIGYVSGRLVELHLGKGLRYVGYIGGVTVQHALFDSRMVPVYSSLSVTFTRIPDYAS